jgi:hypothetical protein
MKARLLDDRAVVSKTVDGTVDTWGLESGCAVWLLILFRRRGFRAILLAFYDARGAIMA